jgi:hypothetical protein
MTKATGRRNAAHDPQRLLKKLFIQFQKQVNELENRETDNPERDAKSLAALAATLERLSEMDELMKKKSQDKKHAAKGVDRGSILRELCQRLEKLAKAEDQPKKPRAAGSGANRRAG